MHYNTQISMISNSGTRAQRSMTTGIVKWIFPLLGATGYVTMEVVHDVLLDWSPTVKSKLLAFRGHNKYCDVVIVIKIRLSDLVVKRDSGTCKHYVKFLTIGNLVSHVPSWIDITNTSRTGLDHIRISHKIFLRFIGFRVTTVPLSDRCGFVINLQISGRIFYWHWDKCVNAPIQVK